MASNEDRKTWLSLLAKAPKDQIADLWAKTGLSPKHEILRTPEVGGVMVRGRAGATGAAFNLGEVTVTRCSVRLSGGEVGHGYVQGRDKAHAKTAALVDALMQTGEADRLERELLSPLRKDLAAARTQRRAKAAATKVDFFTMTRGED